MAAGSVVFMRPTVDATPAAARPKRPRQGLRASPVIMDAGSGFAAAWKMCVHEAARLPQRRAHWIGVTSTSRRCDRVFRQTRARVDATRIDTERLRLPHMTHLNKTFAELGVRDEIARALADNGIHHPFAIQELTLPLALAGDDLIGQARTGMGKTYAFGVPLLHRVAGETMNGVPRALIVVPTRELCIQVADDLVG